MFDVFAHRSLLGLAPAGHGIGSPVIQCPSLTIKYLSQIRADVVQVDRNVPATVRNFNFSFRHISQGATLKYRVAWLDRKLADDTTDLGLDHMLHLHGFHNQNLAARIDAVALSHVKTNDCAQHWCRDGCGAVRPRIIDVFRIFG